MIPRRIRPETLHKEVDHDARFEGQLAICREYDIDMAGVCGWVIECQGDESAGTEIIPIEKRRMKPGQRCGAECVSPTLPFYSRAPRRPASGSDRCTFLRGVPGSR
jgi:hypothetical protein